MKKVWICFVISLYGVLIFPGQVFSLTATQIKEQINSTNSQIEEINKEIQNLSNQIAKTSEEKDNLANAIKELTLTRSKLLKERDEIQKKINVTDLTITNLSSDIGDREKSINSSKNSIAKLMRELDQNDNFSFMERLLSMDNFTSFSNEYNNVLSLNKKIQENINVLESEKTQLSSSKQQKESEKQNLNGLKNDLIQKEQAVNVAKKEKDSLLSATKNKESTYQQMLADKIKKRDTFEKALTEYESQLKFALNPKTLPKEGSSALNWPLDSVLVTSLFGERWGRMHMGIDLRASLGTQVKASASGEVIGAGDTDVACKGASFGKWILIKHSNGLSTVYGHLSVINVKKGQKVKAGDIIGLSGNTGSSTAPHLHLGVFASDGVKVDTVPSKSCSGAIFTQPIAATNAYLNPLLYLPKTTSNMYKVGVL